ncbi:MAG: hypothetical protein JW936_02315 [Sedimentisphaerales bacterium]|nr:hypothetical protein [Sedimentisphaerales bacterium]
MMSRWALVLLVLTFFAGVSAAEEGVELPGAERLALEGAEYFAQANAVSLTDVHQANLLYGQAILRYRSLIDDYGMKNVYTYYNLGNAYLLQGDLGRAILNYRRAERCDAANVDLQNNLRLARARQLDGILPEGQGKVFKTLFFWHYDLSYGARLIVTAGCWVVFWLAGAMAVMGRKARRTAVLLVVIAAVLGGCFGGSVGVDLWNATHHKEGVITAATVVARQGDGENYRASFTDPLHSGLEFEVREQRRDWLKIKLANGSTAWIPADAAELI